MTELELLYDEWSDCRRCHLKDVRRKVVMLRGDVPCDVLMIGEAPGISEDVVGVPLVGPAGKLQDEIIAEAVPEGVTVCLANLIGCCPKGADGSGHKVGKPDDVAVQKCTPRLQQIVRLCQPKLIVCLGDDAEHYLMSGKYVLIDLPGNAPRIHVHHPSAIGRAKIVNQGLMRQKTVVQIRQAIEDHVLRLS